MSEPRNGNFVIFLAAVMVGVAVMGAAIILGARHNPNNPDQVVQEHPVPEEEPVASESATQLHLPLPEFNLDEISGRKIGLNELKGRIWVADFIFTRCASTCPEMTETMKALQDRITDLPEVRLISISVDPRYDTVEALEEYAENHGADRKKWWFLRGEGQEVHDLSYKGFKLGSKDDIIAHSTRFALVDKEGMVRGYYEGVGPDRAAYVDQLEEDIRRLKRGEDLN